MTKELTEVSEFGDSVLFIFDRGECLNGSDGGEFVRGRRACDELKEVIIESVDEFGEEIRWSITAALSNENHQCSNPHLSCCIK